VQETGFGGNGKKQTKFCPRKNGMDVFWFFYKPITQKINNKITNFCDEIRPYSVTKGKSRFWQKDSQIKV